MYIVLHVTSNTCPSGFAGARLRLLVAFLALDLAVTTFKQEACGRMIEIPSLPRSGCMADFTFLAVTALVLVVLLMATIAG